MCIFIHDVQRYDKIETALQGPFGAINPSQIQQLMQQVGVKDVMLKKRSVDFLFFFGQSVFVKMLKNENFYRAECDKSGLRRWRPQRT